MTAPRTPARRVLPLLLGLLLATGAAGAWWLDGVRPVPHDEVVRADAWLRTEAVLDTPSPASAPAASRADVRADLARQLEALGPAPGKRARAAAREQRPAPTGAEGPGLSTVVALRATAATLADDALTAEDPALARVLAAAAASRATSARQLDGSAGPEPDGAGLCDAGARVPPGADPAPVGTTAPGAVLWSSLDRAGYLFEALASSADPAPPGGVPAELLEQGREDVEDLLDAPAARAVLGADPGLPAGAYVLPDDVTERPGRAADTAARDVQEAAAHVLGRGGVGARCWAVAALERSTGLRAGLTGEVDALPGVVRDDRPR